MSVPNRAEHPGRKMSDHTTHMINLHPEMRPYGTSIKTQVQDSTSKGYKDPQHAGQYETPSADHVHGILSGVKSGMEGTRQRGMVHAEVTYHPDDVAAQRSKAAEEIGKQPQHSDPSHPDYNHSGMGRQLAINEEASRRVPDKATSSFKV